MAAAPLHIDRILEAKREGEALTHEQIGAFIDGLLDGRVTRAQAAAWLAFVYLRGMSAQETVALTLAMTHSGELLQWEGIEGPFKDKHSTGGVGDKVSLVLAPLWAELGVKVPMVSGRGLGHTGGTLDKLEAIPGYRTDLNQPAMRRALEEAGCFINGQTGDLAPADRLLYALRNETATVPSIPLITASILSKKLAEGIGELVLDVKFGRGAFMQSREAAAELARSLVDVGNGAGVHTRAELNPMEQPLGHAVGNALEVQEAIRCLRGEGPEDLAELCCRLVGDPGARALLDSGAALDRFHRMVRAHGGDPAAPLRGAGCATEQLRAPRSGRVLRCDALDIARAAFLLGAGRVRADQEIHPGVGVAVHAKVGDHVQEGEPLATLHHASQGLGEAMGLMGQAYGIDE